MTPSYMSSRYVSPLSSSTSSVASTCGNTSDTETSSNSSIVGGGVGVMPPQAVSAVPLADSLMQIPLMHPYFPHHPIPEFLYQLMKMLTDDNREVIEWSNGRIKVHHPELLASEVLHKYFRHSKFASFQRQLNYFGFRKIAGKGKMSPCSYVNDEVTDDLRSILFIKRKTNGTALKKCGGSRGAPVGNDTAECKDKKNEGQQSPPIGSLSSPRGAANMMPPQATLSSVLEPAPVLSNSTFQHSPTLPQPILTKSSNECQNTIQNDNPFPQLGPNTSGQSPGDMMLLFNLQQQLCNLRRDPNNGVDMNASLTSIMPDPIRVMSSMPCPATAAVNAAAAAVGATSGQTNSLFDSAPHLRSLLNEQQFVPQQPQQTRPQQFNATGTNANTNSNLNHYRLSSHLLSSLPSANTLFPETFSSASLSQLGSSQSKEQDGSLSNCSSSSTNCNSSTANLSHHTFLSRDSSLIDLAMLPSLPSSSSQHPLVGGLGLVSVDPTPIQEIRQKRT